MNTAIIINPLAETRLSVPVNPALLPAEFRSTATEVFRTTKPGDAHEYAVRAVESGAARIVVVGGDGTVNETLSAVAGTGVALGVIPAGSANDLARCHGIPGSTMEAWENVVTGRIRSVDLVSVNGCFFATAGGFGFPCDIACRANSMRREHTLALRIPGVQGSGIYVAALLDVVRTHRNEHTTIEVRSDTFDYTGDYLWFLACNQAFLGKRFLVAPGARPDDGCLDLCVAKNSRTRMQILKLSYDVTRGTHGRSSAIRMGRATAVRIRVGQPVVFFGDGEPLVRSDMFDVRVFSGALTLIVPHKEALR